MTDKGSTDLSIQVFACPFQKFSKSSLVNILDRTILTLYFATLSNLTFYKINIVKIFFALTSNFL